jgi:hypothetical protein
MYCAEKDRILTIKEYNICNYCGSQNHCCKSYIKHYEDDTYIRRMIELKKQNQLREDKLKRINAEYYEKK